MLTQKECQELLELLLRGDQDYAELFLEETTKHSYVNFDNKRFTPFKNIERGTGIRVWKGKEVSFYSVDSLDYKDIKQAILKIATSGKGQKIKFTNVDGKFVENDFGKMTIPQIKSQLEGYVKKAKINNKIKAVETTFMTSKSNRLIANSNGAFVKKTYIISGIYATITAEENKNQDTAKVICKYQVPARTIFEIFNTPKELGKLKVQAELAIKLLKAKRIKSGQMKVVLGNAFGAVLFHEAVGHPLEASSVVKNLSQYAKKRNKKVASELVTLVDDGTINQGTGSAKYDDEGVLNQKRILIEKGVLKDFLIDNYHGSSYMKRKPNGAGRRQSFAFVPTSRMSNTYIEKGPHTFDEIIKNTDYGFYAKNFAGGQVNPFNGQFNFGVSEGYIIKDGKITDLVKGATLIGNGMETIQNIDMIADDFLIDYSGTCGAASGMVPVGCGQPTLCVSNMTVGGE